MFVFVHNEPEVVSVLLSTVVHVVCVVSLLPFHPFLTNVIIVFNFLLILVLDSVFIYFILEFQYTFLY